MGWEPSSVALEQDFVGQVGKNEAGEVAYVHIISHTFTSFLHFACCWCPAHKPLVQEKGGKGVPLAEQRPAKRVGNEDEGDKKKTADATAGAFAVSSEM